MQTLCLSFVVASFNVSKRDGVAVKRGGVGTCPCRSTFLTFRRRKKLVCYGTTGRLLLSLCMKEENAKHTESQNISNTPLSGSEENADNQSLSTQGSGGEEKKSNTKKKSTTRRKRKSKKQEQLPESEVVTVPIARKPNPSSGADYWIDPKDVVAQEKRAPVSSSQTEISKDMKDKLKTEVVSPYRQNWILLLIAAVVLLTLAYRFLPAEQIFDHIPDL
ncbi:uncharacterized protein Gasu_14770 [Galdieria sulphuraria]|uniref:Uncharacterized protein n=1 Tax=Galdieria sulphuraria TaxID=130081 RepID=M2X477_GALSU|nr:uncharacterized protein Gasu_14770 [Galdieria sulphuraria]EME31235.1 hypothetical protein Gasu_14770 [Galdieria sulphuraria]|eukprot:XP_005707755.1 hypothetical protein Gasu_14770 [Galdieria sulphuraria]